jgi:hypothetical protein
MSFGNPQIVSSVGTSVQPTSPGANPRTPSAVASGSVALINGTQTIVSYNVPNDGKQHAINLQAFQSVTVAETGGAVSISVTTGGNTFSPISLFPGGGATGPTRTNFQLAADPGTTVTVTQSSALTAGAAVVSVWLYDIASV